MMVQSRHSSTPSARPRRNQEALPQAMTRFSRPTMPVTGPPMTKATRQAGKSLLILRYVCMPSRAVLARQPGSQAESRLHLQQDAAAVVRGARIALFPAGHAVAGVILILIACVCHILILIDIVSCVPRVGLAAIAVRATGQLYGAPTCAAGQGRADE